VGYTVRCTGCGGPVEPHDLLAGEDMLLHALADAEPETAIRAVALLGLRRSRRAVPVLLGRYLANAGPYLAAAIAQALGRIGGERARFALDVLAEDASVIVRWAVRDARVALDPARLARDDHQLRPPA
jgi:HEAT repeat protein